MAAISLRRVGKVEMAEIAGVSMPTIGVWIRRGMPVESRGDRFQKWEIDPWKAAEWYFARQNAQARGPEEDEQDPDRMGPKDRLDWYKGEAEKRKLAIQDRQLIPVAEVEIEMRALFSTFTGFLATLPDVLERDCGLSGAAAERVQQAIDEARDRLHSVLG